MPPPLGLTVSPGFVALARVNGALTPGRVTFTLTNTGDRSVTVRAILEPLGAVTPEWLELEGRSELEVGAGATHTFNVVMAPPQEAPGGEYTFRLNVVDVHRPDEGEVEGPEVAFEVPRTAADAPTASPRWLMIAGATAVVVAAVALAIWWIGRSYEPPQLSPIDDRSASFGDPPIEVSFSLSGAPPRRVELTTSSSNPSLIPDDGIRVLGGDEDRERTLLLTPVPGESGSAEITLIAEDSRGRMDSVSFHLEVAPPVEPITEPQPVGFEVLASGSGMSLVGPRVDEYSYIRDDFALDRFWSEVQGTASIDQAPSPPSEVAFDRQTLLGVRLSQRTGAGLEVARVAREGDALIVELRVLEPASGEMTRQVETAPWLLMSVDDTDAAHITFRDADDGTTLGPIIVPLNLQLDKGLPALDYRAEFRSVVP